MWSADMTYRTLLALSILLTGACRTSGPPGLSGTLVDLTHTFDESTIYWPTEDGFRLSTDAEGVTEKGYFYKACSFTAAEHGGTHIDAPVHFFAGGQSVDEIPLERLIGPGVLVDVSAACEFDRDYEVTARDFQDWEAAHGPLPDQCLVLLRTGFGERWPDRNTYMGTDQRGVEAVADLHFPGLHPDAARWLVEERNIFAIGLDTPSIDHGQSTHYESHQILFEKNIAAFENLAALEQRPPLGVTVIALPMKIRGGSGGPLRIVAVLP